MKSKKLYLFTFALVAVIALSGCSLLPGGGNTNAKPSPTLPFPTNVVVATAAPNGATAVPQNGVGISGQVFIDANANGAKDADEQVIAGVLLNLGTGVCPGTPVAQNTTTADKPSYQFTGLNAGDYCVSIDANVPQNAAILGLGEWTAPQKAQGTIADSVNLKKKSKDNVNFGWTFATLGQATPIPPQATVVANQPTPEPVIATPTAFVQPTAAPQGCVFRANFLDDITIPDNTIVAPGATFVKTWRVRNSGTCAWGPGSGLSNLAFAGGGAMGAPNVVPIPNAIPAGGTGDLSIQLVAPDQTGSHRSEWKLRVDDGTLIGVGRGNAALYALIRVQANVPPTPVPPPTNVPPANEAIKFSPGATEAEVQGQMPAGEIRSYTLSALANQNMQLSLSSNSNTARIAVLAPSGAPLPPQRGNPEGTYWQGNLPANGNYTIQVLAGNGAPTANFSLNVTIPVRIVFAPGAISNQQQGITSNGRIVTFLLKANGGQTMTLNLLAPQNSAGITIYGLEDGQPLIRSQSGATSFNGQLSATQDYVIQVVPFGNTQVSFTLDITVQ